MPESRKRRVRGSVVWLSLVLSGQRKEGLQDWTAILCLLVPLTVAEASHVYPNMPDESNVHEEAAFQDHLSSSEHSQKARERRHPVAIANNAQGKSSAEFSDQTITQTTAADSVSDLIGGEDYETPVVPYANLGNPTLFEQAETKHFSSQKNSDDISDTVETHSSAATQDNPDRNRESLIKINTLSSDSGSPPSGDEVQMSTESTLQQPRSRGGYVDQERSSPMTIIPSDSLKTDVRSEIFALEHTQSHSQLESIDAELKAAKAATEVVDDSLEEEVRAMRAEGSTSGRQACNLDSKRVFVTDDAVLAESDASNELELLEHPRLEFSQICGRPEFENYEFPEEETRKGDAEEQENKYKRDEVAIKHSILETAGSHSEWTEQLRDETGKSLIPKETEKQDNPHKENSVVGEEAMIPTNSRMENEDTQENPKPSEPAVASEAKPSLKAGSFASHIDKVTYDEMENSFAGANEHSGAVIAQSMKQDTVSHELQTPFCGVWGAVHGERKLADLSVLVLLFENLLSDKNDDNDARNEAELALLERKFEDLMDADYFLAESVPSSIENIAESQVPMAKSIRNEFVDGLDDIDKFFEDIDPPDELDVGAGGSSIQEVLMGQGSRIILKRLVIAAKVVRDTAVEIKRTLLTKIADDDGSFSMARREKLYGILRTIRRLTRKSIEAFRRFIEGLLEGDVFDGEDFVLDFTVNPNPPSEADADPGKKAFRQQSQSINGRAN